MAASRTFGRVPEARGRPLISSGRASLAVLAMAMVLGTASSATLAYLRAYPVQESAADGSAPAARAVGGEHLARRAVRGSDFLDPRNPELERLQPYEQGVAGLPLDANGFPDWMRALREGSIAPRASIDGKQEMTPLDLDIVMKNTREMPWVRFPHRAHTEWLDCGNCHPRPFEARAGAARIQMADIFRGQYCGMCHDKVAFVTFFSCNRCHSITPPGPLP